MGLIVNFSDFENISASGLSLNDYIIGYKSGPNREIRTTIADLINFLESASANDLYLVLSPNSAKWNSTYTTVNSLSDSWEESAFITPLQVASASWDSVYSSVQSLSDSWDSVYSQVKSLSDTWDDLSNLSEVEAASGNWNNTYSVFSLASSFYIKDGGNARINPVDSTIIIGANSDQHLRFRAGGPGNNQIRMTILSSGEVGINTTINQTRSIQLSAINGDLDNLTGLTVNAGFPFWYDGVPTGWTGNNTTFTVYSANDISGLIVANIAQLATGAGSNSFQQNLGVLRVTSDIVLSFDYAATPWSAGVLNAAIYDGSYNILAYNSYSTTGNKTLIASNVPEGTTIIIGFWATADGFGSTPALDNVSVTQSNVLLLTVNGGISAKGSVNTSKIQVQGGNSDNWNSTYSTVKTLSSGWEGLINAKDYGATGDGVTNDTAALQTALNYVSGGVSRLYIPQGLYYTTQELKIGSYTYIYGDGIGSTVIKLSAGTAASQNVLTNDQNTKSYLTNLGNKNIVIKDMEIDGNVQRFPGSYSPGSSTRGCGIGLSNVDTAIIENVYVHDCCNHCIDIAASQSSITLDPLDYVPGPSINVTVRNATVSGSGDDCITTHFSKNILIENAYITGSRGSLIPTNSNGIEIDDGSQDVTIVGGYVKNCMRGLEVKGHAFAPAARRVRVYGLTVENCLRNFDIRHIGFDSGDSATAFDVALYNCTSISPVSSQNDPALAPRALKISNYSGVTVKDFTCVGLCDTTNLVTVQEGARNVWINGLSFESISGNNTGITDAFVKVESDAIKNIRFENLRFWNCVGLPFYATGSVSGIRIDGVDAYSNLSPSPNYVINFSWSPETVPYTIKNVTTQGYLSAYSLGTSNSDYPKASNVEIFESIVPANASQPVTVARYGWREGTGQGLNAGVGTRVDFTGNIYTGVSARQDIPVAFISTEKINATDTDLSSSLNFGTADNNSSVASKKMTILPDGNVGIGETNPQSKLTVNGQISATGGNSNQWNTAYTNLVNNSSNWNYVNVLSTDATFLSISADNFDIYLNKILNVRSGANLRINFESSLPAGFSMSVLNESTYNVTLTSSVDNVYKSFGTILSGSNGAKNLYSSATVYKFGNNIFAIGSLT